MLHEYLADQNWSHFTPIVNDRTSHMKSVSTALVPTDILSTTVVLKDNPPAVHHDGPGVRGVHLLHLLQELEHADGREGNAKVRPAGEVKLRDQTRRFGAVAGLL